jgi:ABC-type multidrug transport system permease subunit
MEGWMMSSRSSNPVLGSDPLALRNRQSLFRFAAMMMIAALIAASAPSALAAAAFSSLLFMGAMIAAGFALITGDPTSGPHLTRWDEAAALLALSLFTGFFVDQAAVEEAVRQMQAQP